MPRPLRGSAWGSASTSEPSLSARSTRKPSSDANGPGPMRPPSLSTVDSVPAVSAIPLNTYRWMVSSDASHVLHGSCDPRFAAVRDAFARGLEDEIGAAVVVRIGGATVVDLCGG